MYLDNRPMPGREFECVNCLDRTLETYLSLGWDVHNHRLEETCGPKCAIRSDLGRRYRISVMRRAAFDSKKGFFLVKAIDGLPRLNGTLPIHCLRVGKFIDQIPRSWYEPVRSVDDLVDYLRFAKTLEDSGVPARARPNVLLTLQLFESAHCSCSTTGVIQWPKPGEARLDLHAVVPLRLSEDGQFVEFWNSWGSGWGKRGNGSVSVDYLRTYFTEAWCSWNARWGHSCWKQELVLPGEAKEVRRAWMLENPMFSERLRGTNVGDSWRVEIFDSYSLTDDSSVDVVQLRNGYGLRMGWAFQCRIRDTSVCELRELFVMPAFRHQGIGSCLEGISCDRARAGGATEMRLIVHQADGGVLANRGTARKFINVRGYRMFWRNQTGPIAVGFACKELT
jgi:GNAT superfamily N-acetyltransferase